MTAPARRHDGRRHHRGIVTLVPRESVLGAVAALCRRPPRVVTFEGGARYVLPGGSVCEICRALDTYEQRVTPVLGALVLDGLIRILRVGPYRCYVLTPAGE